MGVRTIPAVLWDSYLDDFRQNVLEAMDNALEDAAAETPRTKDQGPVVKDEDLPSLFKALDAQFEASMVRAGIWRDED